MFIPVVAYLEFVKGVPAARSKIHTSCVSRLCSPNVTLEYEFVNF